jgi:hypothetical protein
MNHELNLGEDSILRVAFRGCIEQSGIEAYRRELTPYLARASADQPLQFIAYAGQEEKFSLAARKQLAELTADLRIGKVAVLGATRLNLVLGTFLLKFTRRSNIRFFNHEEDALHWLKTDEPVD